MGIIDDELAKVDVELAEKTTELIELELKMVELKLQLTQAIYGQTCARQSEALVIKERDRLKLESETHKLLAEGALDAQETSDLESFRLRAQLQRLEEVERQRMEDGSFAMQRIRAAEETMERLRKERNVLQVKFEVSEAVIGKLQTVLAAGAVLLEEGR